MDLTTAERNRLADALNDLEDRGLITTFANAHEAGWFNIHRGPAFLPWHRWFILTLEEELRAIDARITLPYWNWTRSDSRDLEAEPWKSFFGGRDNSGGQFDHWSYTRAPSPGTPGLSSLDTVIDELQADTFLGFRGMEFGSHVGGHTWTGSPGHTMASRDSPGDPLFYLHHCMVDRLWAIWQLNHPDAVQYSLDDDDDYPTYEDTFVPADEVMFGGDIGASVTPASMLDHRALGYYYDRDDALEARVIERDLPEIIPGDPVSVELETPQVVFNDVPEGETTKRAALFRISGCGPVTFHVLSEPSEPFSLFAGGPYPFPSGGFPTDELRIWFLYTAGTADSMDSGTVSIAAEDELGNEIERWEDILLIGNAVERERVAVVAVLDESGSMLYDAGNNRTRLQALQLAANSFIDQLYDDNGLALVEFADSASALTGLEEAGPLTSPTRNGARTEISAHGPPDIYQHTSIGAGLEEGADVYATSPAASNFDIQATLVFTDGVEDRPPYIDEVASSINERVYAIGVADAANVNNDNLRTIADNSGGFMLVTGALALDDEFLLEKFFIQVLAGVVNRDIVRDPPGWIVPGEVERVPFHIARSDIAFDAVALSRAPHYVVLGLQTPDGTVVAQSQVPPEAYRIGASSGGFRISLPLVVDGREHWEGEWQLLLGLRWKRHTRVATHAFEPTANTLGTTAALPYQAVIHARSNLRLRARVDQSGLAPGSELMLHARLTEYGQPLETAPAVRAEMWRPYGGRVELMLDQDEPGSFVAVVIGDQAGVYRFRVVAEGFTARGQRFTREHLLSAVIGRDRTQPAGRRPGDGRDALCELLRCLLQHGVVDERFEKRLRAWGIDVNGLRECVAQLCPPQSKRGHAQRS